MESLAIPFLVFVGGLLALQAAANVQLAVGVGSPAAASTVQLGIGAVLLLVLAAAVGASGALGSIGDARPEHLWGGVGSAVYITAGILLFPRLGAIVAVGLFIAGQMAASLLLDGTGWFGVAREPVSAVAVTGAAAVVLATWMIVRAQAGGDVVEAALRHRGGWALVGLFAGAALPVQGAVNAQLRLDIGAPIGVGAFSFIVATASMALVLGALLAFTRASRPSAEGLGVVPWWGWLGGLCGATYVTSVFVLIPEIGVAPTIALTVAGQQLTSVLVDRYGLLRLPRRPVTPRRLAGVALLLAGVVLIQL